METSWSRVRCTPRTGTQGPRLGSTAGACGPSSGAAGRRRVRNGRVVANGTAAWCDRDVRRALPWPALLLCGCAAAPPPWRTDEAPTLAAARADGRDLAVFFALPGRDQS